MTEKNKRDKGELYDANFDKELLAEMSATREQALKYNNTSPNDTKSLKQIIHKMGIKTGKSFLFRQPFYCDYGYNISVGENFFSNFNVCILDAAPVTIGKNCFIAPNVGLYTAAHPTDAKQRATGLEFAKPITIGDDVWIGASVIILPGITIGSNVVIGAGSVVTKDIPSNTIAVGNPCKVIKKI
ncbi:MAG: sugar O-acetyltransferase [Lactobacillus sp.]|nr:sugar O-acetyltransferase [Lactobacillus sp.]